MKKFIALALGALLHVSVPAFAKEPCDLEPMESIPAQAKELGAPFRILTNAETQLVVDAFVADAEENGPFDSSVLVIRGDGLGLLAVGRGGYSCGLVPFSPQTVLEIVKMLKGTGA
jgi:hypothetical protein